MTEPNKKTNEKPMMKVTWGDAHGAFVQWTRKPKPQKPKKVISVGICIQDDEVGMTLVQSVSGPCVDSGIFIPRCNIEEIEEL